MRVRKEYTKGELVNGLEFIEDVLPITKRRKALFKCYCGNEFITRLYSVKDNTTKSCGCLQKEVAYNMMINNKRNLIHNDTKVGEKRHYLYSTWSAMKQRCYNENAQNYKHYGGKNIQIFKEWKDDYSKFKEWILENLGERPEGKTLDRYPNNKGNYEPNNLRWATLSEQNKNRNYE